MLKPAASLAVLFGGLTVLACEHEAVVGAASGTSSGSLSSSQQTSSSSSQAGSRSSSSGSAPVGVTGTMVNRYFTSTTTIDQPVDLRVGPVEAYVWQGASWQTFPGAGAADGSFTIPTVPTGRVMVNVLGSYVYTAARVLDLGTQIQGRPDAVQASPNDTFAGTVHNVAAFSSDDTPQLGLINFNAQGGGYLTGTVSGSTFTGQSGYYTGGLVDASKGDSLYLLQWSNSSVGTIACLGELDGIEQTHGVTMLNASVAPLVTNESATIDYRGGEFVAAGQPGATSGSSAIDIETAPGSTQTDWLGNAEIIMGVASSVDVNLGTIDYANPFQASWGEQVFAGASFLVGPTPGHVARVTVTLPLELASSPIRPLVTPIRGPMVNGQNAFSPLTGISTTPVISWSPPSVGAPSAYIVRADDAAPADPSKPYGRPIVTTTTSVPFPPGLLQEGHTYVFLVTAVVLSIDATTAPFRRSIPTGSADTITATMQP